MTDILDCSNPIDGAAARRQGYAGVARYLTRYTNEPKMLTAGERDNLLANGCTIVLVYEDNTGDALGGSGLGSENGQRALDQARALGAPQGTCIYLACDTPGATPDQVRPYYQAAGGIIRAAGYRVGFYGPQAAAYALLADNTVDRAWVVETWRDGYSGDLGPFHLMQRVRPSVNVGGVDCDEDAICNADYGQWGSAPVPQPTTDNDWWVYA